ncbi:MAG: hypothetical protein ACOCZ5_00655 [bacterium]
MKYRVKNLTNASRKLWVKKSSKIYFFNPFETRIIEYEPMKPKDKFRISVVKEKKSKIKKSLEDTSKENRNKSEEIDNGEKQYVE